MLQNRIQEFTESASPDNWLKYADEIRLCAKTLWEDRGSISIEHYTGSEKKIARPSISRTFMLLLGLSIENTFKGYLIAINPHLINTGKLDKKIDTHDLSKLAKMSPKILLDNKEIELLKILSEAIPNWGRYPIPLHHSKGLNEKYIDDEFYKTYKQLYQKIFNSTLEIIKDGWDALNGVKFNSIEYNNLEDDK